MSMVRSAVTACIVGLVGLLGGFMVAAGGDGWVSPLWVSLLLPIAYPVAVWRWQTQVVAVWVDAILSLTVVGADIALVYATLNELSYFQRIWRSAPIIAAPWAAIWVGWQFMVVAAVLRRINLYQSRITRDINR